MAESSPPRRLGRSAAAVFAGLLVNVIPAVAIDAVLHAAGVFPPLGEPTSDALLALAFSYRFGLALAGGAATAALAPRQPVGHALVLGGIGVVFSTAGAIAMRDLGHVWYPVSLVLISMPCSWAGARWRTQRGARLDPARGG